VEKLQNSNMMMLENHKKILILQLAAEVLDNNCWQQTGGCSGAEQSQQTTHVCLFKK